MIDKLQFTIESRSTMRILRGPSFKRRITSKLSVRSVRLLIIPFYMKLILAFYPQKVPRTESFRFRKKIKITYLSHSEERKHSRFNSANHISISEKELP